MRRSRAAVAVYLGSPPLAAAGGEAEVLAVIVAVPEAAMHDDDGVEFGKLQIGAAGKLLGKGNVECRSEE